MPQVTYINTNQIKTTIEIASGLTVMHGATLKMLDGILAECGGAMTCVTCHCYIDTNWLDKTGPAIGKEKQKLGKVNKPQANSRLSCQIKITPELDGLIVYFPETQVWSDP